MPRHHASCGERAPNAVRTWAEVKAMRRAYHAGESIHSIARRFGVERHYLRDILARRAWSCCEPVEAS